MVFFLYIEHLKIVEIHLELVRNHVLKSHLRDIFCLEMYALVTLAHIESATHSLSFGLEEIIPEWVGWPRPLVVPHVLLFGRLLV